MGAFVAYTLYSGIFLLAGYLFYKWLMASEKQPAMNRYVLLGIYMLSFAAEPLSHLRLSSGHATGTGNFGAIEFIGPVEATAVPVWPKVLLIIYVIGAACVLLWTLAVAVRICLLIARGTHRRPDGYTLVLVRDGVAPFSWGRYIVMTEADYNGAADLVLAHELAHIRHGHSIDLLMSQAVCVLLWYNPAAWLMREELKAVHEYQADDSVLASGVDARHYQMLLIKKAVGTRFQSLANSLNHSKLKLRITMMYKKKNGGLRRMRGLVLGLAPVVALAVVNIPAVVSAMNGIGAATLAEPEIEAVAASGYKVSEKSEKKEVKVQKATEKEKVKIDKFASYPGGENEMYRYLSENISYPSEAAEKGIEGRVVVGFTVESDGTLSDFHIIQSAGAQLDQEAVRVVSTMPKWEPAVSDGKAVACKYAMPVTFKLTASGKKEDVADPEADAVKEDVNTIDEVRVIGYGTQKKDPASVEKDTLTFTSVNKVVITEDNAPDIIIDGKTVPYNELSKFDPSSIESITVMKDKTEHPNGLIIITLKK